MGSTQPGRGAAPHSLTAAGHMSRVDQGQVLVLTQSPASSVSQGGRSLKPSAVAAGAQAGGSALAAFCYLGTGAAVLGRRLGGGVFDAWRGNRGRFLGPESSLAAGQEKVAVV